MPTLVGCMSNQTVSTALWVWSQGKGWLWTNPGSYRYLYQADTHRWLYFLKLKDGQPRFYNHITGTVE
jgi:hypothetical protein